MDGRRCFAALGGALLLTLGLSAPSLNAEPGPGYFASDNVEHIAHIPLNNDAAGARVVGDYLYITTSRDLKIYDLTDPTAPVLTGVLPLPQTPYFAEEDVDTNGSILLIDGPTYLPGTLNVVDVEDKSNPTIVGTLKGVDAHTMTCLFDCRWAWGNGGEVVDLRDPTKPRSAGDWMADLPIQTAHDVTEVAPGLVVTSSDPVLVLDARRPTRPKVLAAGTMRYPRGSVGYFWMTHGNMWPRSGRDRFLMTAGETTGPQCDETKALFNVWDMSRWKESRSFRVVGSYHPTNGLPTDGNAPADLLCGHWFDPHPSFRNGGLVALGWYDHGVRFIDVGPSGDVEEVGYFMPTGGSMSAAYWVTKDIVYAVDYHRGVDVLRFSR